MSTRDAPVARGSDRSVSVYVHVPFCVSRCHYCDFYSHPLRAEAPDGAVAGYLRQLGELHKAGSLLAQVPSVYIGGGTPTALEEGLLDVLGAVAARSTPLYDAELTVEANPESTTSGLVRRLSSFNVTRVSLGIQSMVDSELAALGRCHDSSTAERAARMVVDRGIGLSVDLMCGLPGQTIGSWTETLRRAVGLGAEHMSVYAMSVEEGTPLADMVLTDSLAIPDLDLAAKMMLLAETVLREEGLERYEVANYAVPGCESRHNLRYWTGGSYVGLGPGAYSMLEVSQLPDIEGLGAATLAGLGLRGSEPGRVRFVANRTLGSFLENGWGRGAEEAEYLDPPAAAREDVMLGLRLTEGVRDALVREAGQPVADVLTELAEEGLVTRAKGCWRTTERGWLLGNEVFGRVWNAEPSQ